MKRTAITRRRWIARLALGLTVVAVAAPSAQGMIQGGASTVPASAQVTDGLGRPLDVSAVKGPQETAAPIVDVSKFRLATQVSDATQVTDGLGRPLDVTAVESPQETATPIVDVSRFRLATQLDNEPVRPDDRAVRPTIDGGVQAPVVVATVDRPTFDWNDAGIGVGIGVAAALCVLAAWMLLGRRPGHAPGA